MTTPKQPLVTPTLHDFLFGGQSRVAALGTSTGRVLRIAIVAGVIASALAFWTTQLGAW